MSSCFWITPLGRSLDVLQRHLPLGAAWLGFRVSGKRAYRMLFAFALAFEDAWTALCTLAQECNPYSAVDLLPDWEQAVGLPDPCLPGTSSLTQRRANLLFRLNKKRWTTAQSWIDLAENLFGLGVSVTPGAIIDPPGTGTFVQITDGSGGRTIGPSAQNAGFQFIATDMGSITSTKITNAAAATSGSWKAQIWSDVAGNPGVQIGGDSNSVAIAAAADYTFTFSSPISIVNGTKYWVVIRPASGTPTFFIDTCGTQAGFGSGRNNTITSITATGLPSTATIRCAVFYTLPKKGLFRVYIDVQDATFGFLGYPYSYPLQYGTGNPLFNEYQCLIDRLRPGNVVVIWNNYPRIPGSCFNTPMTAEFTQEFC